MALTRREQFEKDLKDDFIKVEDKLKNLLDNKTDGIYKALQNIEKYAVENAPDPVENPNYDAEQFKKDIWENISKEWSTTLSSQITSFLQGEFTDIMSHRIFNLITNTDDED